MTHGGSRDAEDRTGIFLTGATGLVGGLLLRRLAEECPNRPIFALVRNREAMSGHSGLQLIPGDITEPGLGMPERTYNQVCGSVGAVVHCAASTHLAWPLDESRRVNVEGTANVLAFARRARNLKLFLHISSTHIAGRTPGELHESPLRESAGWFSPYEQSKFEAEQLIFEHANGLPWTVVRLSTLVGNSLTGKIAQFNYFHQLIRFVRSNPFPVIPGTPGAPVDVVADDWVTQALLRIVQKPPAAASVLHLCAGPSQSLPAHEVLELAYKRHRQDRPGSRAVIPCFVSLPEFEAFLADARNRGAEKLCRMAELLLLCLPHLEVHQDFLNTNATMWLAQSGVTPARTREFLPLVIASCFQA